MASSSSGIFCSPALRLIEAECLGETGQDCIDLLEPDVVGCDVAESSEVAVVWARNLERVEEVEGRLRNIPLVGSMLQTP